MFTELNRVILLLSKASYSFKYDGVVKSPIYGVAGFLQTLYILHVLSRPCKKHCALYIELFS